MTPEEATTAAVAGEDAAVYAYGLVGARLPSTSQPAALAALQVHRLRRDRLRADLVAAGATPPPAAVAYDPPFPVTDEASARRLAAVVEQRLVPVYADLAAATTGQARADAVRVARESATRAISWGAQPQAFPGSP